MKETKCDYQYTVRRGDSFYLIAHRLGVPLRDLLEANSDINPARLTVGDVLCIPTAAEHEPAAPAEASPETDAVQAEPSADLPEPVPQPQTVEEPQAMQAEDEALLDHPAVGDDAASDAQQDQPSTLSVPADDDAYTVAQDETAADIQLAADINLHTLQAANPDTDLDALTAGQMLHVPKENVPCPVIQTYTLRAGESLESAALRLNVSVGALLRANPCMAPGDFVPGLCIAVPEA